MNILTNVEKQRKINEKETIKVAKNVEKQRKINEKETIKVAKNVEKQRKINEKEAIKVAKNIEKQRKINENNIKRLVLMNSFKASVKYNGMEEADKKTEKEKKDNVNEPNYIIPNDLIINTHVSHKDITTNLLILPEPEPIINKGTGAGGYNTNYYGKQFEEKTNNEKRLLGEGFTTNTLTNNSKNSYDYYLSKTTEDKNITFVLQNGLKKYMKKKYNIEMFRCPDEAYIIEYNTGRKVIKILEKKEQRVNGSVETKLWSGPSLKREYELVLGEMFEVYYGFCVSSFLKKKITSTEKKYTILQTILNENNIVCLFGDDEDYFETFDLWLNNSL